MLARVWHLAVISIVTGMILFSLMSPARKQKHCPAVVKRREGNLAPATPRGLFLPPGLSGFHMIKPIWESDKN